ncbi:MAG: hypothetical protein PHQ42_04285 [Patescibacteria group bacterium]|nr:hypothetical protein [Patescibacteria group bacterium]
MKKTTLILTVIICLVAGYALGNFFPLNIFARSQLSSQFNLPILEDKGIQGDARLEVILKMDDGRPLNNVEVDVAEEPGPPPIGGVAISDDNGLAVFDIKSGNYFIFFNDNNFPKNVKNPEAQAVEVKAGEVNQKIIILTIQ